MEKITLLLNYYPILNNCFVLIIKKIKKYKKMYNNLKLSVQN